jgi:hypothetical protein
MCAAVISFGAMRRSLMPVRVRIHSSEVSNSFARSSFVTTLFRQEPAGRRDLDHGCGLLHGHSFASTASERLRALCFTMPERTARAATARAFRIAFGGDPP